MTPKTKRRLTYLLGCAVLLTFAWGPAEAVPVFFF